MVVMFKLLFLIGSKTHQAPDAPVRPLQQSKQAFPWAEYISIFLSTQVISLATLVSNSLSGSLTWPRCQLKTFDVVSVADVDADNVLKILKLRFGRDFETEFLSQY